jgi:hypothetical protein
MEFDKMRSDLPKSARRNEEKWKFAPLAARTLPYDE